MLDLVFGRHFGFPKCRELGGVKGVGRGREEKGKNYLPSSYAFQPDSHTLGRVF